MGNWYKVVYRQIQPIHLGYKKHGVINETRIFIIGQSMWGALTNAYFKNSGEYNETLFENITCFYPMINNAPLYPRYEDGEFYLGDKSEREFRKDFTTTYISTSINPTSLNAKDESLHEIDIILPKDNIQWVGYVKIEDKNKIPNEIYIGGDSRYGFGRMERVSIIEENYPYKVRKGIYQGEYPKNEPILNFVKFNKQEFEGELELLAEFKFDKVTPKVEKGAFYIEVGAEVWL